MVSDTMKVVVVLLLLVFILYHVSDRHLIMHALEEMENAFVGKVSCMFTTGLIKDLLLYVNVVTPVTSL